MLSRIWSSIVKLDQLMRVIPSLAQIWLVEFMIVIPLCFFIGKLIDIGGGFGIPGSHEPFDKGFWVFFAVAMAGAFFFFKNLLLPRFRDDTFTPIATSGPIIDDLALVVANTRASVTYPFFTSHPAYALLLTTTVWIPIVMVWMCQNRGGNNLYYLASGVAGIWIVVAMAILRCVAYYALRLGAPAVRRWAANHGLSPARVGWEMAWRPTLILVGMMYSIVAIPVTWFWINELRTISNLPLANIAMADTAPDPYVFGQPDHREWVRVEGVVIDSPVYWPTGGVNRGGDNYMGTGIRIRLDAGGEALVLAESLSVPDLRTDLQRAAKTGRFRCSGYLTNDLSPSQRKHYGLNLDRFPDAPDGRVIVIHGYP